MQSKKVSKAKHMGGGETALGWRLECSQLAISCIVAQGRGGLGLSARLQKPVKRAAAADRFRVSRRTNICNAHLRLLPGNILVLIGRAHGAILSLLTKLTCVRLPGFLVYVSFIGLRLT